MNEYFANYLSVTEQSEWLRPEQLAHFQAGRLARVFVQHAYEHAPFYRERLAALFDVDGSLYLARWHEIPVLDRSDVTLHFDQMRVAQLPSEFGSVRESPNIWHIGHATKSGDQRGSCAQHECGVGQAGPVVRIRRFPSSRFDQNLSG